MTDTEQDPISGHRMARRLIRMVGALHERGFESLYLYCGMNGSGSAWRYSIGALDTGGLVAKPLRVIAPQSDRPRMYFHRPRSRQ